MKNLPAPNNVIKGAVLDASWTLGQARKLVWVGKMPETTKECNITIRNKCSVVCIASHPVSEAHRTALTAADSESGFTVFAASAFVVGNLPCLAEPNVIRFEALKQSLTQLMRKVQG